MSQPEDRQLEQAQPLQLGGDGIQARANATNLPKGSIVLRPQVSLPSRIISYVDRQTDNDSLSTNYKRSVTATNGRWVPVLAIGFVSVVNEAGNE